jgi:predicted nucleic acid-binding protein
LIVLDASAAIEWLLQTSVGESIDARLFGGGSASSTWCAPHLIDVEVAQVLRRRVAAGRLEDTRAREAIADLLAVPIVRYPHDPLLPRIWHLRENLTAYDAAYVVLAEALDATLITCDRRLRRRGHQARVEVVGDRA